MNFALIPPAWLDLAARDSRWPDIGGVPMIVRARGRRARNWDRWWWRRARPKSAPSPRSRRREAVVLTDPICLRLDLDLGGASGHGPQGQP